mmetsp:Transcript_1677/g.3192  ORF Transcript_1677/g.3192 Transcript_1677/m.3192 type:complete len:248 (-) Transcript_1677:872-1615(-)
MLLEKHWACSLRTDALVVFDVVVSTPLDNGYSQSGGLDQSILRGIHCLCANAGWLDQELGIVLGGWATCGVCVHNSACRKGASVAFQILLRIHGVLGDKQRDVFHGSIFSYYCYLLSPRKPLRADDVLGLSRQSVWRFPQVLVRWLASPRRLGYPNSGREEPHPCNLPHSTARESSRQIVLCKSNPLPVAGGYMIDPNLLLPTSGSFLGSTVQSHTAQSFERPSPIVFGVSLDTAHRGNLANALPPG